MIEMRLKTFFQDLKINYKIMDYLKRYWLKLVNLFNLKKLIMI